MKSLSPEQIAWSRNMQTQILQAVDKGCQKEIAEAIGVDSSTVSRLKEHHLATVCNLMAAIGLKVVPANMKCYNEQKIDILFRLAKDNFQRLEQVDDFFHDDAAMQIAEGTYQPRSKL
ncbi:CII family transcriptional regulator [Psychrobacter pygoscelis]|uniref:CII family transcriptional regulator n=1 Tax=Psychrobacter pygoscelis TaxID=2488563 RepID=UPI00103CA467|nr:CII family transcriptional regulator [Psychrobacter pygoscelis]